MTGIEACLFDLDGVIVDTAKYHFLAWKQLSDQLGINFTEQDNERLKGVSRMRSLEIILEIGGKVYSNYEMEEMAKSKNEIYLDFIHEMKSDELLPGVKTFLTELKGNRVKIGLGSASKNAGLILKRLQITDLFDVIIDGNKIQQAKPDPEVFLKGAEALNIKPELCVVFEDAVAGVEAAKNAGMYCVGVGDKQVLLEADYVIAGFQEFTFNKLKLAVEG